MNMMTDLNNFYQPTQKLTDYKFTSQNTSRFSLKNERKILKAFLLSCLHELFNDLFHSKLCIENNYLMECYKMDNKTIQLIIHGIVETGEYTLEGIALYTRIPFDVVYNAACGIGNECSITLWARIIDLFIQIKPDIAKSLIDKLLEIKNNRAVFSLLLNETEI